jgi:hypothetical protein
MGKACSTHGEKGKTCRVLVRMPERKKPVGRYRRIILKCILEKYDGDMDWINLSQDRDTDGLLLTW